MKVYVVTDGEYSDYHICRIFSNKDAAEQYCERLRKVDPSSSPQATEWVVNGSAPQIRPHRWTVSMNIFSGEISEEGDRGAALAPLILRNDPLPSDETLRLWAERFSRGPNILVASYVSLDHARKLAAEVRQRYLALKHQDEV